MIKSFLSPLCCRLVVILPILFAINSCRQNSPELNITSAENYPRWLMNDNYHTNQTSGITFLNKSGDGTLQFLLADDIGKIHRFFIKNDTVFSFSEIKFSKQVIEYLSDFPKLDFEEIFFDKFSGNVYLTIEGNGDDYLSYHGIYRLNFKNNDVYQDSIVGLEKLGLNLRKNL